MSRSLRRQSHLGENKWTRHEVACMWVKLDAIMKDRAHGMIKIREGAPDKCTLWRRTRTRTVPRMGATMEGVAKGKAREAEDGETPVGAVTPLGRVAAAGTTRGTPGVLLMLLRSEGSKEDGGMGPNAGDVRGPIPNKLDGSRGGVGGDRARVLQGHAHGDGRTQHRGEDANDGLKTDDHRGEVESCVMVVRGEVVVCASVNAEVEEGKGGRVLPTATSVAMATTVRWGRRRTGPGWGRGR
jgi:hypothetical protein